MRYTYIFFIFLNLIVSVNLINTIVSKKNTEKIIFIILEALEALKFGLLFFLFYSDYILNPYVFKWIVFVELLTVPCLLLWGNIPNILKHKKKYFYGFCSLWTLGFFFIMQLSSVRIVKFRGIGYVISMIGEPYFYVAYILIIILIVCAICILNYKRDVHLKYIIAELVIAFICLIESMLFIFDGQFFIYSMLGELSLNLYLIYLIEKPK